MNLNGILVFVLNTLAIIGAVAAAVVAVQAKKLIDSVIALAATGSFIALEFILLQAPDVAIAEASVGAVLSTVLYIIALRKVRAEEDEK
ncbi:MAG: hydrogenase subunit MbhD domain-containing protein [Candidatus Onthomonas sp.]|nr:hydrogenase subunit MbhD domain-containing protein [Candidatus Onthomonas sp.]